MSVVGFDIGNMNTVIAVARNRGIDVICNEVSNRATPTLISFGQKQRYIGESAKSQEIGNYKNTVGALKRLVGRSINEREDIDYERSFMGCDVLAVDNTTGVSVNFQGEEATYSYTQLVAMYLGKLKEITEKEIGGAMSDCVISIPVYYTDAQRRALLEAGEIAGLNILRLIHDVTAAGLQWGITKTDLPESEPKYVAFVDIGASDCTVQIAAYVKGKMMVKGTAFDRRLGGRDFDQALASHFVEEFKTKYKMDISSNSKALFRLRSASEKVKKMLSANANAPLNVECLMNDKDVSGMVERGQFEDMIAPLLARLDEPLQRALESAGITVKDVDSIELIGGTTRIPSVKAKITTFFGKDASTTLNQDECVAKGCTFMCAILSPVFKTREFKVEDSSIFPIKLVYPTPTSTPEAPQNKEMIAFPSHSTVPSTKLLTFFRKESFDVEAFYSDVGSLVEGTNPWIAKWTVKIPEGVNGDGSVKVRARLNSDGILEFGSAQYVEEVEASDSAAAAEAPAASKNEMEIDETNAADEAGKPATTEKKKKTKKTDLSVVGGASTLPKDKILQLRELENSLYVNDRLIVDTEERKNALEAYVYEMRNKIETGYAEFIEPATKEKFLKDLSEVEDWLYGEGEEATKSVYVAKLAELERIGAPVARRYRDAEQRQFLVEGLKAALKQASDLTYSTEPAYDHITGDDRDKVKTKAKELDSWLRKGLTALEKQEKYKDSELTADALIKARDDLNKFAQAIFSKPKPKVEQPTPAASPTEKKEEQEIPAASPATESEPTVEAQSMDVDTDSK